MILSVSVFCRGTAPLHALVIVMTAMGEGMNNHGGTSMVGGEEGEEEGTGDALPAPPEIVSEVGRGDREAQKMEGGGTGVPQMLAGKGDAR